MSALCCPGAGCTADTRPRRERRRSLACAGSQPPDEALTETGPTALLLSLFLCTGLPQDASAALSNPNTRLPSSATVALRRSLPVLNAETADVIRNLEDVQAALRIPQRKPWTAMAKDISEARALVASDSASMLRLVPERSLDAARSALDSLDTRLRSLDDAIAAQDSEQTAVRSTAALGDLAVLSQLQCPSLPYSIPAVYASRPRLNGRATVALSIEKAGGGPQKELRVVLAGYSSPLTAGNFGSLVSRGLYDGATFSGSAADETLFLTPSRPLPPSAPLPLEVRAQGSFEPQWRSPLDVFGGGELPVLPLSVYGAVAAARGPSASESDPGAVFLYRYSKATSGLGGLSFSEGEFSVFAYTAGKEDQEVLRGLRTGDRVVQARIVEGAQNLMNG